MGVELGTLTAERPAWPRGQRAAAVFGPALIVAIVAIAFFATADRYRVARGWVTHTRNVLAATQTTIEHVQDAETGQRGYLLTRDAKYLGPYRTGSEASLRDVARLRALTADNAAQQRRIDALDTAVRAKLAELEATVRLADAGRADSALSLVRTDRGRILMDSARRELATIAEAESTLFAQRDAAEERAGRVTIIVVIAGAVIGVLLSLLTNGLLVGAVDRHAAQAREIAMQASELTTANEHLADQQVELESQAAQLQDQQVELEMTNDHLQAQATELEARQEELMSANRAKSQFLSTMSHELRTPLNGIAGHAQLIDLGIHGPVTGEQRAALGRIMRAQQHLLVLINDVLNLSRIEAGKIEYDLRAVPLGAIVRDIVPMIEPLVAAQGTTLRVDVPDDDATEAPLVWADEDRLRQVLLNLLSNASKFTPAGGAISISLADVGDAERVGLSVRDTGRGIPASKLAAIFEPFVQVHRDAHDIGASQQGTGLGLAISRDLMHGMGGDITVESTPDVGSTFTIVLRRAASADGGASA